MITRNSPQFSIIVLLEEAEKDFHDYIANLDQVFTDRAASFEILIMANGTEGFLRQQLDLLKPLNGTVKAFVFNKRIPQAVCLKAGLNESVGRIIMVCGSYQQITSDSFFQVLDGLEEGIDVVTPSVSTVLIRRLIRFNRKLSTGWHGWLQVRRSTT